MTVGWHHRINPTKLMDGLSNYFLDEGWKAKIENTCWKKMCHNWELNPYLLLVKQVH